MRLSINRQAFDVEAPEEMPLLWVLRDLLGLTGTKFGCGMAQCGACTVHVDGHAVRSCGLPAGSATDVGSALAAMKQGAAATRPSDARTPTIVFHGDRDATVHPLNGEQIVAAQAGARAPEVERARSDNGREYLWHWGDNGTYKNFVLAHLPTRSAIVVFTNGNNGMRINEAVVAAASGHEHLAFDWL